jgi:hypothetical protein
MCRGCASRRRSSLGDLSKAALPCPSTAAQDALRELITEALEELTSDNTI